jgi:hypothetical protein
MKLYNLPLLGGMSHYENVKYVYYYFSMFASVWHFPLTASIRSFFFFFYYFSLNPLTGYINGHYRHATITEL